MIADLLLAVGIASFVFYIIPGQAGTSTKVF